jgi:hypothetical protein
MPGRPCIAISCTQLERATAFAVIGGRYIARDSQERVWPACIGVVEMPRTDARIAIPRVIVATCMVRWRIHPCADEMGAPLGRDNDYFRGRRDELLRWGR